MSGFGHHLKRYFFTGLALIMPVVVTLYVLVAVFRFVDNILGRFINLYLEDVTGFYIPGLGFILFFLIIVLTGFLAIHFFGRNLFPAVERWFSRLPFIKQLYPSIKKIFNFVFSSERPLFRKVVMVEYPRKGTYSLGFVVNEAPKEFQKLMPKEMATIFIPNSPGPLTGYFIIIPKDEVIFLEMAVEDGLKMVLSGGVVNPDSDIDKSEKSGIVKK